MSSGAYLYLKKCKRHGIPVEGEQCSLCEQEAKEQEQSDDRLAEALARLHKRGKLTPIFGGKVSH